MNGVDQTLFSRLIEDSIGSGEGSQKFATEQYDTTTTGDAVDRVVDVAEAERFFADHLAGRVSGIAPSPLKNAACLYTTTPDRGFILDWHPALRDVFVVSACSGHGFKHSAGIGECIAKAVLESSARQLAPFSLRRFGLSGVAPSGDPIQT